MNQDDIADILEQLGIPADKVAEATLILSKGLEQQEAEEPVGSVADRVFILRQKAEQTDDWKEKARLAAQIISEKMDDY